MGRAFLPMPREAGRWAPGFSCAVITSTDVNWTELHRSRTISCGERHLTGEGRGPSPAFRMHNTAPTRPRSLHRPECTGQCFTGAVSEKMPAPTDRPFVGSSSRGLSSPSGAFWSVADTGSGSWRAHLNRSHGRLRRPGPASRQGTDPAPVMSTAVGNTQRCAGH